MSVTENIVTGRKYRLLHDALTRTWDRISFWTASSDVEMGDGHTLEQNLGAIKGITTSTSVGVAGYAADARTVSNINNNMGGLRFGASGGKYGYYVGNTFYPFSSVDFESVNVLFPNLIPCMKILKDITRNYINGGGTNPNQRIVRGLYGTNISPGMGSSGSSGRFSSYCAYDGIDYNYCKNTYGYVPIEESYVNGQFAFGGYPNPYFYTRYPYCDINVYNIGTTRYYVLYVASCMQ